MLTNKTQLTIQLSGSGTIDEIKKALQDVISSIEAPEFENDFDNGIQLEDSTLYTVIELKQPQ